MSTKNQQLAKDLAEIAGILNRLKFEPMDTTQPAVVIDASAVENGLGVTRWCVFQDENDPELWHTEGSGTSGSLGSQVWSIACCYTDRLNDAT